MSAAATTFVDRLGSALASDRRIQAWQIRSVRRRGLQTYLAKDQLESERRTDTTVHEATVLVTHDDRLGRAVMTLGADDAGDLARRLEDTVYMASLGRDQPWALPGRGGLPRVDAFDSALAGERVRATSRGLVDAWRAEVARHRGVRPSSMELFCGEESVTLRNSLGLEASASSTRVSLLTLLLADGPHPSERYAWDERRRVADLDVRGIVGSVAEQARDLTQAQLPPSGQFAVVIDAEEMVALLGPIENNASAESLHQKSSRFTVGEPLPQQSGAREPVTIVSNATLPFGLASYAFDGTGVPGQRVEIVKDGVFARPWATKQFADYVGAAPTGEFANWELPAGRTPLAELTADGGRVLYVHAFSWLTPDQARGNFGSEIRLGYLYENGKRTAIKGGTVSGNVFTALGSARFSKETVFRGNYRGPRAVRFESLTVAGA